MVWYGNVVVRSYDDLTSSAGEKDTKTAQERMAQMPNTQHVICLVLRVEVGGRGVRYIRRPSPWQGNFGPRNLVVALLIQIWLIDAADSVYDAALAQVALTSRARAGSATCVAALLPATWRPEPRFSDAQYRFLYWFGRPHSG